VRELHVWRVREERVPPRVAASRLAYAAASYGGRKLVGPGELAGPTSLPKPRERREIAKTLRGEAEEAAGEACGKWRDALARGLDAAAAVAYGAPLLLLQAGAWVEDACGAEGVPRLVGGVAQRLLGLLEGRGRRVRRGGGRVEVLHLAALHRDGVKAFLAEAALALYAAHAYREHEGRIALLPAGEESGRRRVAASVDALESVTASYIAGPASLTAGHEVSLLRPEAPAPAGGLYDRLRSARKSCGEGLRLPLGRLVDCSGVSGRVFAAHGGLNSDIVEVACAPGGLEPLLAYTEGFAGCLQEGWARKLVGRLASSIRPPSR
jgi:hypothetical protein